MSTGPASSQREFAREELSKELPAAFLGSKTGQTHSLLTRSIFGLVGSATVSLLLIGVAAGWTAFAFNLLATMYDGLFSWPTGPRSWR